MSPSLADDPNDGSRSCTVCFTITTYHVTEINALNLREVAEWYLQSAEIEPERWGYTCIATVMNIFNAANTVLAITTLLGR